MAVVDPRKFLPLEEFTDCVDNMLEEFKRCPPAAGVDRVYVSGEIEASKERLSEKLGIEISGAVAEELRDIGKTYDVGFPF